MALERELIIKHLLPLLALHGVSGREAPVIRYVVDALSPLVDDCRVDPMGNIFALKKGTPGPRVLIAAHSDEVGLIVKSIEPEGFLRFEKVGGVGDNLLPGRVVTLAGRTGIVGVKAGHLSSVQDRSQVKPHTELYIDVGAESESEVVEMGIRVGTPVAFVSPATFVTDDVLVSKALDDRVGIAVMLALVEMLADKEFAGELHFVITVQEEIGLRGAQVAAYEVNPDLAIAVDTVPSGDTPEIDFNRELPIALNRGPVLQVTSRSLVADTTVVDMLEETAKKADIPYQLATFSAGNTDAAAMHLARSGIPSGAVTIPRRYSHSPVEVMNMRDADRTLQLLAEFVTTMPSTISWKLPGETW